MSLLGSWNNTAATGFSGATTSAHVYEVHSHVAALFAKSAL